MYKYMALLGLINRRNKTQPVTDERRARPSSKEAKDRLIESIDRLQETVARLVEQDKKNDS